MTEKFSPIGEAIRRLREDRGWTQSHLGGLVGLTASSIGRKEVGKISVPRNEQRKFAEAFGITLEQFEAEWRAVRVPQQRGPGIPVINKAPAGTGDYTDMGFDNGVSAFDDSYLPRSLCPNDETAFACWVEGDSMVPEFRPGDLLICSPREAVEGRVADGDVVYVRFGSELDEGNTIKRVYDRGDEVELVADNRQYKPTRVLKEHIVRMAKVVRKITTY